MTTFVRMKTARRWLVASPGKVPHYTDGTPRRGKLDTSEDLARLATYSNAKTALERFSPGWHLGFALGPDGEGGSWQGIDLDKVDANRLGGLVPALPGYVETSPSGKGFHAIGYGRPFERLGSNGSGIEAYCAARYFTVTENVVRDGRLACLADHVESALAGRYREFSAATRSAQEAAADPASAPVQISLQVVADLRSALHHMRSDDYGPWIEMGHALKPLGDVGRGLWMDWSATSSKFDPAQASEKWDGFDPQHTGYQAVFARAQRLGWVNPVSSAAIFAQFAADASPADQARIVATPFAVPNNFDIPPRPWVFGRWLLRGTVTTVIAPGGAGKSALMVAAALSLASGQDFLGKTAWGGAKRVWLWNLEDGRDEMVRQLVACCWHHEIFSSEYAGRLFVNDASTPLCTAIKGREGLIINEPINAELVAEIRCRQIDVLIIDPFVSSHRAEENDNGQVDAIAKRWAGIARETNCSIVLVHHSRKLAGQQVDAEAARGASALGNAARAVLVLNRMDAAEAKRFGISEDHRRAYIRVSNDKANRAPAGEADWFRLVSVRLANNGPEGGDSIGVIERWTPPDTTAAIANFDDATRARVQVAIAAGEWREHSTARKWVGYAIASTIGADLSNPADKQRVKALLADMLAKGQLRAGQQRDESRKLHPAIVVGDPIEVDCASPAW